MPIMRDQADKSADVFGRNMKDALIALGKDAAWLSRETGISTSTLSDYSRGKLPRADKAADIAATLGVTVERLLSDQPFKTRERRSEWRGPPATMNDDLVKVAEIDPRFGLGGAFMDEEAVPEMRTFSRAWLRHFTDSPPDQLYWAQGRGNSMEPAISDGDVCLIDRSDTTPKFGDTYWAIAYGHVGMIKRLRPMPDGSVKILSDNQSVPPETAYEGELYIFGRVVAVVKRT